MKNKKNRLIVLCDKENIISLLLLSSAIILIGLLITSSPHSINNNTYIQLNLTRGIYNTSINGYSLNGNVIINNTLYTTNGIMYLRIYNNETYLQNKSYTNSTLLITNNSVIKITYLTIQKIIYTNTIKLTGKIKFFNNIHILKNKINIIEQYQSSTNKVNIKGTAIVKNETNRKITTYVKIIMILLFIDWIFMIGMLIAYAPTLVY